MKKVGKKNSFYKVHSLHNKLYTKSATCVIRGDSAITLIALIITIIVLLILAGVSLSLIVGDEGILGRAENVVKSNEKAIAQEEIKLAISELIIAYYDSDRSMSLIEYLKENLQSYQTASGNIITCDENGKIFYNGIEMATITEQGKIEWKDKTEDIEVAIKNPNIKINLEKSNLTEEDVRKNHYEFATIKATVVPKDTISKVTVNGKKIDLNRETGELSLNVTENGIYKIVAYEGTSAYNEAVVQVSGLSEDLNVATKEQLVEFQKSVNTGRTYKGKKVTLKSNLNIADIQWTPIGYYKSETDMYGFKGIFDGEGHTIDGLKINSPTSEKSGIGFFGMIEGGTLKNLNFTNVSIYSENYNTGTAVGYIRNKATVENVNALSGIINMKNANVGGICGCINSATEVRNCYNNITIKEDGSYNSGGISGVTVNSTIEDCYNIGTIGAVSGSGGISGSFHTGATIRNCYNTGNIIVTDYGAGGIAGTIGWKESGNTDDYSILKNCYNKGNVKAEHSYAGGIIGKTDESTVKNAMENVFNVGTIMVGESIANDLAIGVSPTYLGTLLGNGTLTGKYESMTINDMKKWTNATIVENLGNDFVKDEENINEGLPILSWQKK